MGAVINLWKLGHLTEKVVLLRIMPEQYGKLGLSQANQATATLIHVVSGR